METFLQLFACGGTIDKVYFDAKSDYQVGLPQVERILLAARVTLPFRLESLFRKDSLDLTDEDRAVIRSAVESCPVERVLITHGTDHMPDTARALKGIPGKTIVLTGANTPALCIDSDAAFNIGCALAAVQCLPEGVYIVLNGQIYPGDRVKKNRQHGRFDLIE
jgi:L-asparaginase